jgi:hypothetical protein
MSEPAFDLVAKTVPIDAVHVDPRNARKHGRRNLDAIAGSLAMFGQRRALIVMPDMTIVAGNGTLEAARSLGWSEIVVTVVPEDWTPEQARAYALADNRTAELATWDDAVLQEALLEVEVAGFDPAEFGFTRPKGAAIEDEAPEPPAHPVSKVGDLYVLGGHRLLCGDSTDPEQVKRLMDGERAIAMLTDPPYLVDYDGGNHPQSYSNQPEVKEKHWDTYVDHGSAVTFYQQFLAAALGEALTDRPTIYQWFGMMRGDVVLEAWRANDLLCHQVIISHKSRPVLSRTWFMYNYEPCMVGWIKGNQPDVKLRPDNTARAVWDVDQREGIEEGAGHDHPTMKPVELWHRPIQWHSRPGKLDAGLHLPYVPAVARGDEAACVALRVGQRRRRRGAL